MARLPFTPEELEKLIQQTEKEILARICSACHMGVLKPHHQYLNQRKCETCGYTVIMDKKT